MCIIPTAEELQQQRNTVIEHIMESFSIPKAHVTADDLYNELIHSLDDVVNIKTLRSELLSFQERQLANAVKMKDKVLQRW